MSGWRAVTWRWANTRKRRTTPRRRRRRLPTPRTRRTWKPWHSLSPKESLTSIESVRPEIEIEKPERPIGGLSPAGHAGLFGSGGQRHIVDVDLSSANTPYQNLQTLSQLRRRRTRVVHNCICEEGARRRSQAVVVSQGHVSCKERRGVTGEPYIRACPDAQLQRVGCVGLDGSPNHLQNRSGLDGIEIPAEVRNIRSPRDLVREFRGSRFETPGVRSAQPAGERRGIAIDARPARQYVVFKPRIHDRDCGGSLLGKYGSYQRQGDRR